MLDWELTALQRKLTRRSDEAAREAIRQRFLHEICAADRDVIFYVGNQAKRPQIFSVLGVFSPPS